MTCVQCSLPLEDGRRVCLRCHALQPVAARRAAIGPGATRDLGYGRVTIQARLGAGGMGVVWRAWLFFAPDGPRGQEPPVPLALKVLRPQAEEQAASRVRFAEEAEALKRLRHPNVVGFYDFFEWEGTLALGMELVEGSTLEDLISRLRARAQVSGVQSSRGLPLPRAWYYFQQLLGALAATHAIGLVHRDVKPSNMLIRSDGIVKLSDYGIAQLMQEQPAQTASKPLTADGTGAYMSPEQVLARPIDARSDLYSAAVVFYEMLAGRPPFSPEEKSEFTLRQDQVETAPPPLTRFVADAPRAVEAVLARALAKDREQRFSSALELGDALRVALGQRDTPAWAAQREIAMEAPSTQGEKLDAARIQKHQTLHEFVISGYRAANPTR